MGEEPWSGVARWGGAGAPETVQAGAFGRVAAPAEHEADDGAWRAVAPGVRVRADADDGLEWGAGAGFAWGSPGPVPGDAHRGAPVGSAGSAWAAGRSRRSGDDGNGAGPGAGARVGIRRIGAVLGTVALVVVLVRIAVGAPDASIPASSAPPAASASGPADAAADPSVGVSPPATVSDPSGTGPTEWAGSLASDPTDPSGTSSGAAGSAPPAGPPTDPAVPSPVPNQQGPVDWWSVLAELDRARASALAARAVSALDEYAASGSPAWDQDAGLIGDLEARGLAPVGLTTHLVGIERAPEEADRAPGAVVELVIVDERSDYSLVDDAGAVVEEVPASGLRRWRVRLAGSASPDGGFRWLLQAVEPMP